MTVFCPHCDHEFDEPGGVVVLRCPRCDVSLDTGETGAVGDGDETLAIGGRSSMVADSQTPTLVAGAPLSPSGSGPVGERFGEYEILGEIARGGMGVVYRAKHTGLDRVVALKMILSARLATETDVRRFHTEARIAARLDHSGIIPIYEVGEHDGQHFYSMALVEGGSLRELVRDGPVEPQRAAELVREVAEAVRYAHSRNVVHRDLKPSNVLLDENGQPKVTDFGLAKSLDQEGSLTATGHVIGTPGFMPPEQAAGRTNEVGPAADVYALGAILSFLLTGRPPFHARTAPATLHQVLTAEPESPRSQNPQVDLDLATICLRCLEKDPSRRYASAAELAAELGRFVRGVPIEARPVGVVERARRWCRRNPPLAALSMLAIVSLVAGVCASTFFLFEARARAREAAEERDFATRQEALAWTLLYIGQIRLAFYAIEDDALVSAREVLESTDADERSWEYFHLRERCRRGLRVLDPKPEGTPEPVTHVAIADGGSRIVVRTPDGWVRVLSNETGKVVARFGLTSDGGVRAVATDAAGRWIVGAGLDRGRDVAVAVVWEASSGEERTRVALPGSGFESVAVTPDGSRFATRDRDGRVFVWETASGERVCEFAGERTIARGVAFSPDGRRIVVDGPRGGLFVHNVGDGAEIATFQVNGEVSTAPRFSPDGTRLAVGCADGVVWLLDATTGETADEFSTGGLPVPNVAFDRTGLRLAAGGQKLHVWDAVRGTSLRTLAGRPENLNPLGYQDFDVAFTPDGTQVLAGSSDGLVRSWSLSDTLAIESLGGRWPEFGALAFDGEGRRLAAASGGDVVVWDVAKREPLRTLEHAASVTRVDFARDGDTVAVLEEDLVTGRRTVRLWDVDTGRSPQTFEVKSDAPSSSRTAFELSDDGRTLLVGDRLWRLESGDEDRLVARGLALAAGGDRVAVVEGTTIQVHDVNDDGALMQQFVFAGDVSDAVFLGEGDRIVVAGTFEGRQTMSAWNVETGRALYTITGDSGDVIDVDVTADGRRIVSVGAGESVKLWDAATGELVLSLRGRRAGNWGYRSVECSPDGRWIAACAFDDPAITLWDAPHGED